LSTSFSPTCGSRLNSSTISSKTYRANMKPLAPLTFTLFQTLAHIILNVNTQFYKGRSSQYCVIKTKEFLLLVKDTWIFFFFSILT
jgi:hypothetical protein